MYCIVMKLFVLGFLTESKECILLLREGPALTGYLAVNIRKGTGEIVRSSFSTGHRVDTSYRLPFWKGSYPLEMSIE